jgi:hypothetical protein
VRFSSFKFIELVISFMFMLGFMFLKMLYEIPSMSNNLPEQLRTFLSSKRTILWLFWALFLDHCIFLSIELAQNCGGTWNW